MRNVWKLKRKKLKANQSQLKFVNLFYFEAKQCHNKVLKPVFNEDIKMGSATLVSLYFKFYCLKSEKYNFCEA